MMMKRTLVLSLKHDVKFANRRTVIRRSLRVISAEKKRANECKVEPPNEMLPATPGVSRAGLPSQPQSS